ncbi:hypothetical protein [Synechococcus elongatus]|uniref:hypothetical protein n=1 Tax=Synechococcus elongatus TaxID=32046 RepID=UPI0018EFEB93|nr:hypothetical protein [Synechococcus elongatus]WKW05166.1 hypothetical protein QY054_11330 [Synechococcus elongatus PCC 7942 = FACHB-805]
MRKLVAQLGWCRLVKPDRPLQIISLWSSFLLGILFHTQLGLMPLFHGRTVVVESQQTDQILGGIFWGMLIFFAIPMLLIAMTAERRDRPYRRWHFGFTVLYSVLNFSHLLADIAVQPVVAHQIFLMGLLFAIGLKLNQVAWAWLREA